ncbi:MAG: hypothetical protein ACYC69_07310 [Thermodesulfovibrionales bacterium]
MGNLLRVYIGVIDEQQRRDLRFVDKSHEIQIKRAIVFFGFDGCKGTVAVALS